MIYITRKVEFNAVYAMASLTDVALETTSANQAEYYKWEGHDYELYVTLKGEINPEDGYLLDLKILKAIIEENVTSQLDHKNLSTQAGFMLGKPISLESLCLEIFKQLQSVCFDNDVQLYKIRLVAAEHEAVYYNNMDGSVMD
jgi:6-pyruvoyltetrahydropterin/6-carboxytetrahydropterin synthase